MEVKSPYDEIFGWISRSHVILMPYGEIRIDVPEFELSHDAMRHGLDDMLSRLHETQRDIINNPPLDRSENFLARTLAGWIRRRLGIVFVYDEDGLDWPHLRFAKERLVGPEIKRSTFQNISDDLDVLAKQIQEEMDGKGSLLLAKIHIARQVIFDLERRVNGKNPFSKIRSGE